MSGHAELYTQTERRLSKILADLGSSLTEVEYRVALGVLSQMLVKHGQPIKSTALNEIDDIASAMHRRDVPFMHDLHKSYESQITKQGLT
jgi:hypothetical protein